MRACAAALWVACRLAAQPAQDVYTDALDNGWENWSWAATQPSAAVVHSGTQSLQVNAGAWQAVYFHHAAQDGGLFKALTFWLNGGPSGGQSLQIQAIASVNGTDVPGPALPLPAPPANQWRSFSFPATQLAIAGQAAFDGFWIQDATGNGAKTFFVDDVQLTLNSAPPATNGPATVAVDAALDTHPISSLIYGVAFATSNQVQDLRIPLNRSGGNSTSRYNWRINAYNHAADFYFESLAEDSATPAASIDDFIAGCRQGGAAAMVTIPTVGWAPKLGPGRGKLASYSIQKYGPQTDADKRYLPDAGNGVSVTNNTPITWNDPNDANIPADVAFQTGLVQHLTNRWNTAVAGGPAWYLMDNEVSLWHSTHRDIHPVGAKMEEIRDKIIAYASMVKSIDPTALVAGPEEWGWPGYFWSGFDQQAGNSNGWTLFPDRAAHGGQDYLPWLLDQLRAHDAAAGRRLLDAFTVHYYPQSGEDGTNATPAMQILRNRSTRSLWDSNYTDVSWIASKVMLIPRLRAWAAAHYPGVKVGLTEYSWGAEADPGGATAQADVLGILGREGVDLATRWTVPPTGSPAYNAFKIYRNYDGRGGSFGDVNARATVANPDAVASFAAVRSGDGALTVMIVNKQLAGVQETKVSVAHFNAGGAAKVWQLAGVSPIRALPDVAGTNGVFSLSLPAQSVTLMVLPAAAPAARPALKMRANGPAGPYVLDVQGSPGATYVVEEGAVLNTWTPVATNTLGAAATGFSMPVTAASPGARFYRALAGSP